MSIKVDLDWHELNVLATNLELKINEVVAKGVAESGMTLDDFSRQLSWTNALVDKLRKAQEQIA